MERHSCNSENAGQFAEWIKTRGGLALWRSINLPNPGASWTTPVNDEAGNPVTKPTWQAANEPERIITSTDEVEVCFDKEVKRVHVAVRQGSNGLSLKVTDGGTRRIRREVAKAGKGAYCVFDYSDYENAVIMAPERTTTLTEWLKENQPTMTSCS